jgi:hypothetical protein
MDVQVDIPLVPRQIRRAACDRTGIPGHERGCARKAEDSQLAVAHREGVIVVVKEALDNRWADQSTIFCSFDAQSFAPHDYAAS